MEGKHWEFDRDSGLVVCWEPGDGARRPARVTKHSSINGQSRERLRKLCDTQTGNPLSRPDPTEHVAR